MTIDIWEREDWVELSVSDHGEGILATDLPHIFERFYRSENAPEGGSGLGLAIVRAHIEAHGGTVGAENHDNGARFNIKLPRESSGDVLGLNEP